MRKWTQRGGCWGRLQPAREVGRPFRVCVFQPSLGSRGSKAPGQVMGGGGEGVYSEFHGVLVPRPWLERRGWPLAGVTQHTWQQDRSQLGS